MKTRTFAILLTLTAMCAVARGQASEIGLRLSGGTSLGGEMLWRWNADAAPVELAVGWEKFGRHADQTLSALRLWQGHLADGFVWTAGVGARLAWQTWAWPYGDRAFAAGLALQAGVEYRLAGAPLTLSLDIRPHIALLGSDATSLGNVGLALRYRF